jgi:hypothetical protein
MRGDFSRIRFSRQQNYSAVLEQQGRVALDSDANEQALMSGYITANQNYDLVGPYGVPAADPGFGISLAPDGLHILIAPGRYYVAGTVCENTSAVLAYEDQPHLAGLTSAQQSPALMAALQAAGGEQVLQVTLQMWQQLVTALDDPSLLEPAIGQADTTARLQTAWRVVAALVPASTAQAPVPPGTTMAGAGLPIPAGRPNCCAQLCAAPLPDTSIGIMTAATPGTGADCGCGPVAAAGYQGTENQLYRVEIHQGGAPAEATFKWSRENGSVVTAITQVLGLTVTVAALGPDTNLGFAVGQWVELTDDSFQFGLTPNQPGTLYLISGLQGLAVTLTGPPITVIPTLNARMRRWDQAGPAATASGLPLTPGVPVVLESGIEVTFGDVGSFQPGDYWTIPARSETGSILWPPGGSDGDPFQRPASLLVYNAPLACIEWETPPGAAGPTAVIEDARPMFSTVVELSAPPPPAIHITEVSFRNDDITTLDQLVASGVVFTLDQAITSAVSSGCAIVTLEALNGAGVSTQPAFTVVRTPFLLDASLSGILPTFPTEFSSQYGLVVNNSRLLWQLPFGASQLQEDLVGAIDAFISAGASEGWFARLRFRLLGRMIFASSGNQTLYLDGQALGQPGTRLDGETARVDLAFPSGSDAVASDFEGWFYVAPTLMVAQAALSNQSVTVAVNPVTRQLTVTDTTNGQPATPTITLTLNYPALPVTVQEQGSITLSVTETTQSATPASSIISVPASVPLQAGSPTITVPISVIGNPGLTPGQDIPITLTFAIAASLGAAAGQPSVQTCDFSVVGVTSPPPVPISFNPTPLRPVTE